VLSIVDKSWLKTTRGGNEVLLIFWHVRMASMPNIIFLAYFILTLLFVGVARLESFW
jgi:hypothetical protein